MLLLPVEKVGITPTRFFEVLRLDALDPVLGGNKVFKLVGHQERALALGAMGLESLGGPFSNHLLALAEAGRRLALPTRAWVRGGDDVPEPAGLAALRVRGMTVMPASRTQFSAWRTHSEWQEGGLLPDGWYRIPEGGGGEAGLAGASTLAACVPHHTRVVALSVGSGTTAAALHRALPHEVEIWAFPAIKGQSGNLHQRVLALARSQAPPQRLKWITEPQVARFGICPAWLISWMKEWHGQTGIEADTVYTSRLFWALTQHLCLHPHPPESVLAIHTGGLGWKSQ
jgi:1-aminocyclopropane-1-carboxylate deaminase